MNRARRLIHAEEKEIFPYDGSGVTAAILDTGIAMHPDLAGRAIGFKDFVGGSRLPYDDCGHGTHVAGCLCGNGSCSGGRYAGVARGCRVLVGKVLDEKGDGTISHMIEGIDWVLEHRELYQVKILNISVSMGTSPEEEAAEASRMTVDPEKRTERERLFRLLTERLQTAWEKGLFVVVAAGNRGQGAESLSRLGMGSRAVTVECCDGADGRRHPEPARPCPEKELSRKAPKKPDLAAPGTGIISCNAFFRRTAGGCRNAYTEKSGTSMSTPLAAGAAALCFQKYPQETNEQIRRRMLQAVSDPKAPLLNVARMLG